MKFIQALLFLAFSSTASAAWNATWSLNGINLYITDLGSQLTEDQVDKLGDTFFQVYPKERQFYNTQASSGVRFIFDPQYKGVAETWGDEIRINPEYVQNNPQDLDFITHETMHVVQFSKSSNTAAILISIFRESWK
jgi:hypothetical protein